MDILLVCSTQTELNHFLQFTGSTPETGFVAKYGHRIFSLVCGVGPALAAYHCGVALSTNNYQLVINLGIGGAIHADYLPGDALAVSADQFYMLGSEDHDNFLSVFDLGFAGRNAPPYEEGLIRTPSDALKMLPAGTPQVEGLTVQCVHGSKSGIEKLKRLYPHAAVESQEGAAVMMASTLSGVPCMQLRGISNRVEPRNRAAWQIEAALNAVAALCDNFLKRLY